MLAKPQTLTEAFLNFTLQAQNILCIKTETDYQAALAFIEYLLDIMSDSEDDPLNILIEIVSRSIEQYESQQEEIVQFEKQIDDIDPSLSVLRTLIDQHHLTLADFQAEIGSESLVSMILSGQSHLTVAHITQLSKRFHLDPALFF